MPFFGLRDGSKLFYKEEGTGKPPLVLVHGWTMSSLVWQNQIPYFSKYYRTIVPDLKGHGASDKPKEARYKVKEFVEEVDQLVDKLVGKDKFVFCGHSMGAMMALEYAIEPKFSKKLKGLIVAAGRASWKGNPAMKGLAEALKKGQFGPPKSAHEIINQAGFHTKFIAGHRDLIRTFNEETAKTPDYVTIRCLEAWVEEYDVTDKLGRINVPTLILTSDSDGEMDPKESYFLKEHIKGSQLVEFKPKIGHHPMIEDPDQFNKTVKAFIEKLK